MISKAPSSPRHSRILCFYDLSGWPDPKDIQILPPSLLPGQHHTLVGRSAQEDLSLSGFCFLVEKELLYSHGFRITSHHRWSQHHWCWSFLVTTSATVTKALCRSSGVFLPRLQKNPCWFWHSLHLQRVKSRLQQISPCPPRSSCSSLPHGYFHL